jgi:tRNA (guanine26-N2/guanine27-N2)-dimethyltransferase
MATAVPVPEGFAVIKEGQASVLVPKGNKVFYNPVQEFNRDLSIVVLTQFAELKLEEIKAKGTARPRLRKPPNTRTTVLTSAFLFLLLF